MRTAPAARPADAPSEGPQAADVLLATIGASPLGEWLLCPAHLAGDAQLRLLARLLRAEIGYYRIFGGVLVAGGSPVEGVAAWAITEAVLTDGELDPLAASRRERLESISPAVGRRILAVDDASRPHRPAEPRIHLAYLAALDDDEAVRGALLDAFHHRADEAGVVACADADDETTAAWYAGRGWTVGAPYDLPDSGPRMWPLSRSPRPGAA